MFLLAGISFLPFPYPLVDISVTLHGNGNKNQPDIQPEFKELKDPIYSPLPTVHTLNSITSDSCRVFPRITSQSWFQLAGMNVVPYYIAFILKGARITGQNANLQTFLIQCVLHVVKAILAILFTNRWGHRLFLHITSFLMAQLFFLIGGLVGNFRPELVSKSNLSTT
ncbi:hypothetical protein BGZ96_006960 [Linnemannia gamsii]|uniref:Uncharacterized protein n=1 Tax=Linnemannia gamsii TaxID=64522 RepID=A0ABQ7K2I1_9FUNG|nr:hypothetical protein BGZ96_006960 [Linnemannia gamsii]